MSIKKFARSLKYINHLRTRGKLSFLRNKSFIGGDIDIQFRGNYLNLYYKGASLIKFRWINECLYEIIINKKYLKPIKPEYIETKKIFDDNSIICVKNNFKIIVNQLKANIRYLGKGRENVFEQLFIENNLNKKNRPEFIIIDRQIVFGGLDRLDLIGLSKIAKSSEYRLNLIELKYGEDPRIPDVYNKQLDKYYAVLWSDYPHIAEEYEKIIQQKIKIDRWPYRQQEYKISRDPTTVRKIAVFGNIKEESNLIIKAKQHLEKNTFYVVQNNILREEDLKSK